MLEIQEDATNNLQMPKEQKSRKTLFIIMPIGIVLIVGLLIYFTMGLFVVQPIGVLPEGATFGSYAESPQQL